MNGKAKRRFNTEGYCDPEIHYMVRLDERLQKIREQYVDQGSYFIINRGRQYGKTTTLRALEEYLNEEYLVVSVDFQGITTEEYRDEATFATAFMRLLVEALEEGRKFGRETTAFLDFISGLESTVQNSLSGMFNVLSKICKMASRPVVLMVDEVDSATNNQVFIDFLSLLRHSYLKRRRKSMFHSVILAGVYDIKNLKLKIRPEQEHQYNSPWNIAAVFDLDMSFSDNQIAGMLHEYEGYQHTGMDVEAISGEIYRYTSGYPYLVSAICKTLDEKLPYREEFADGRSVWTHEGILAAVSILLKSNISLFDSLVKQLDTYQELQRITEDILYRGMQIPFSAAEKAISLGCMFGFLKEEGGRVAIANRIFEMYLLNLFAARESLESDVFRQGQSDKNRFVRDGKLDMDLVLAKFVEYFHEIYGDNDERFIEKYGRKFFLLYLKPIINGTGNYYLEAQTRDERRTDVIVDYHGEQFIVELKIWYGNEYNERGREQLAEYLDFYHKDKGYMLSFNFNQKKEIGVRKVKIGNKTIVEAVV